MLSQEENDLLTQTDRGTPCGELIRRYWQPVALTEELPETGCPPLPVKVLGEDLVLFRNDRGEPGLLGLHCSHRGADLSYGRVEDGGLRCIYHGWLYDVHGRCLEQPGEPAFRWTDSGGRDSAESTGFEAQSGASDWASRPDDRSQVRAPESVQRNAGHEKIQHPAYPCIEKGGLIFAYLGLDTPPLLPAFEFLDAPPAFRFVTKYSQACNYLQANEGNIDQAHLSFLHRRLTYDRDESQAYLAADTAPVLEPELADFGLRLYSVRHTGPDSINVKISNFLYPNIAVFSGGMRDGYCVHIHVPIDDEHHWKYIYHFHRASPMPEEHVAQFKREMADGYRLIRTAANRYLQDRAELATQTYSGMGSFFHAQDACVTEAAPIQDRTRENLGYTDRAIFTARKLLMQAMRDVQEGRDPPLVVRDPAKNAFPHLVARADDLPSDVDWKRYWQPGAPESLAVGTGSR